MKNSHKEFIRHNKILLKTQQTFKSDRHNVFTEEINKISSSSNDDKRMQSNRNICIETYAHGMNKNLLCIKEEIKCNNIIKQCKNI